MHYVWERPVIVIFHARQPSTDSDALAVVRARRLTVSQSENGETWAGRIEDFFSLMGDIDRIQSDTETEEPYILCIFNNAERAYDQPDRITGVTFPQRLSFIRDQRGKRTYHGHFTAQHIAS
jgi:hypothetical protein